MQETFGARLVYPAFGVRGGLNQNRLDGGKGRGQGAGGKGQGAGRQAGIPELV